MTSQLPEWMRNPQPARTTLSWKIGQAMRRNAIWRRFAAINEWRRTRYKVTERFPKTAAILTWFLLVALTIYISYWIYELFTRAAGTWSG